MDVEPAHRKALVNMAVCLIGVMLVPGLANLLPDKTAAYTIGTIAFHVGVGSGMLGVLWIFWGEHRQDISAAIRG